MLSDSYSYWDLNPDIQPWNPIDRSEDRQRPGFYTQILANVRFVPEKHPDSPLDS
jgi:hypothetical protein